MLILMKACRLELPSNHPFFYDVTFYVVLFVSCFASCWNFRFGGKISQKSNVWFVALLFIKNINKKVKLQIYLMNQILKGYQHFSAKQLNCWSHRNCLKSFIARYFIIGRVKGMEFSILATFFISPKLFLKYL